MPKLSGRPPKLGRDGRYAVVYCGGKKIRLGKYGTEEAQKNYFRVISEWAAHGIVAGLHNKTSCLIDELALSHLTWAEEVCGKSDFRNIKTAIKTTLEIYSGISVEEFGPRALITVQDSFVKKGTLANIVTSWWDSCGECLHGGLVVKLSLLPLPGR